MSDTQESLRYIMNEIKKTKELLIENKTAVIIIGKTGTGKSCLLNCLAHIQLRGEVYGTRVILKCGDSNVAEIADPSSSSVESVTKHPNFWYTDDTVYCDCPGFGDTRGDEREIINAFLIQKLISDAGKGLKIILMIEEKDCFGNSDAVLSTLSSLSNLIPRFHEHLRSIAVVLSKFPIKKDDQMLKQDARIWFGKVANNKTLTEDKKRFLLAIEGNEVPLVFFHSPNEETLRLPLGEREQILACINKLDIIPRIESRISVSPSCMLTIQRVVTQLYAVIESRILECIQNDCGLALKESCDFDNLKCRLSSLGKVNNVQNCKIYSNELLSEFSRLISDAKLLDLIEYLDFCIRIASSDILKHKIEKWREIIQNTTNSYIKLLYHHADPLCEEILTIYGGVISLRIIKNLILTEVEKGAKTINILCSHKIFIDDDIELPSINMSIMSSDWKIVGKPTLSLRGKDGMDQSGKAADGEDNAEDDKKNGQHGKPGYSGHHGGNFLGIGTTYSNLENLLINVSGGNGGRGQNGGNGGKGKDGNDGSIDDVKSRKQEALIARKIYVPTTYFQSFGKLLKNLATFNSGFYEIYQSDGEKGHKGGDGGKGGAGGMAGEHGEVKLQINSPICSKPKILQESGKSGENGSPGKPGEGGRNGITFYGEYYNECVLSYLRGISEEGNMELPASVIGSMATGEVGKRVVGEATKKLTGDAAKEAVSEVAKQVINKGSRKVLLQNGARFVAANTVNKGMEQVTIQIVKEASTQGMKEVTFQGVKEVASKTAVQGMNAPLLATSFVVGIALQGVISVVSSYASSYWIKKPNAVDPGSVVASSGNQPQEYNGKNADHPKNVSVNQEEICKLKYQEKFGT